MTSPTLTLKEQRALCKDLDQQWRRHLKICHKCLVKTAARARFCDSGWDLVRQILAAKQLLDQLTAAAANQTPTLF